MPRERDALTLIELLDHSCRDHGERPALADKQEGAWQSLTYAELAAQVRQFACGLMALGIDRGDRVAMISENRPEWVVCDFGILSAAAVNVAMFPSLPSGQMQTILADSGAWLLIVGSQSLLEKALVVREAIPDLQIITLEGERKAEPGVLSLAQVMKLGESKSEAELEARRGSVRPEDLASIVYTSGTSGEQKGVMLTHSNFTSNVRQCQQVLHFAPEDVLLSVLPLNHVFERTAGCYLPLACGSQVAYAESLRRLRENLLDIRPTFLILVPRFFEMLRETILDRMHKAPVLRRRLFFWALAVGQRALPRRVAHRALPPLLALERLLADWLVFSKLRAGLGLSRIRHMVSGAAALALEDNRFFQAIGIEVLEGYGLTEAAPVVACNPPGKIKLACVGPPLPGIELRIGEKDEILVRGDNVMQGYYHKPEATAATLDGEGWLHTGDVGRLDEDGYLSITDRLKDLLVLTSGKNVAPQPIENGLRTSPYISQAVVLGDRRQYVTALIVPAFERLKHWGEALGLDLPGDRAALAASQPVQKLMREEIQRLTEHLADFEKVRDSRLLTEEFTVEGGELTPTLKVKRRVVLEKYGAVVTEMYG
jgi:long-chain acyl-CoA synthetase